MVIARQLCSWAIRIARYNNVAKTKSFIGQVNLATGLVDPLRDEPKDEKNQLQIPSPGVPRLYPMYLLGPSTEQRANLEPPVIAFDLAGIIAQIPLTVDPQVRKCVIDMVKRTDIRQHVNHGCLAYPCPRPLTDFVA